MRLRLRRRIKRTNTNKKWNLFWKIFLGGCLTVGIALIVFIGVQIYQAPDISEIDATPNGYMTTILDKDGNITKHLSVTESNRIYVKLDEIPKNLQQAFIAIEDNRFYTHGGIDLKGIMRAAWKGVSSGFKFTQGASTLTQQLLKNNVFTSWMEEETLFDKVCRKVQEQYLAIRLEQEYSKEWILENYLNTINLGGGTRGVQVAAQYYFGKDVSELSLAQCAMIAGITKNPSAYNPFKHPEKSVDRQHLVLAAMLREGYISQEQYDAAMIENVISKLAANSEDARMQVFSWFEDAMLEQIIEDLMYEYTYDENTAWDLIYSGGLTIYSTEDPALQEICETVATDSRWYSGNEQISIVLNDAQTGAVAAIVGGREEKTSSLIYNRATDSIRQPGSTIKVIGEYAAAMDKNMITLGSVVDDAPHTYFDGTAIHNSYGEYRGQTTIRDAVASSSNVVALKLLQQVGLEEVYTYLQKFGLTTLTEEDKHEALAIGGTYNGVTTLDMTAAYNAIANAGQYAAPYFYTKVVDHNGKIILERGNTFETVISKESADLLTLAMEEVIVSGTGKDAAVENLSLAGKSGTTNQNKDLWFIGFSSYYTCGIWGGYDDNSEQGNTGYVKQIWHEIMAQAHNGKENKPLVDTSAYTAVTICKKCGNLAVEKLCSETMQGDMTREEYFIKGTEPTGNCDCHVKVTLCKDSNMEPNVYCPLTSRTANVYLKTGTEGTTDIQYALPKTADSKCDKHTNIVDTFIPSDNGQQDDQNENTDTNEAGGWSDFFNQLFGN